jgi:hypothetical protein
MKTFMLHFSCHPSNAGTTEKQHCVADLCVIASSVEEAEDRARDLIASRAHHADTLIAFSEISEKHIASLSELEATLYLKAQQHDTGRALLFSEWSGIE